jgi:hypothetical protein
MIERDSKLMASILLVLIVLKVQKRRPGTTRSSSCVCRVAKKWRVGAENLGKCSDRKNWSDEVMECWSTEIQSQHSSTPS